MAPSLRIEKTKSSMLLSRARFFSSLLRRASCKRPTSAGSLAGADAGSGPADGGAGIFGPLGLRRLPFGKLLVSGAVIIGGAARSAEPVLGPWKRAVDTNA